MDFAVELESLLETRELAGMILALPPPDGEIFLRRYLYCEETRAIAEHYGLRMLPCAPSWRVRAKSCVLCWKRRCPYERSIAPSSTAGISFSAAAPEKQETLVRRVLEQGAAENPPRRAEGLHSGTRHRAGRSGSA